MAISRKGTHMEVVAPPKAVAVKLKGVAVMKPVAPTHPPYAKMIEAGITALNDRRGSSRLAIFNYIVSHFDVGEDARKVSTHLGMALKKGLETGFLTKAKGVGLAGSFRLGGERTGRKTGAAKKRVTKASDTDVQGNATQKAAKPKSVKKSAAAPEKTVKPKVAKPKAPMRMKPKAAKGSTQKGVQPAEKPKPTSSRVPVGAAGDAKPAKRAGRRAAASKKAVAS